MKFGPSSQSIAAACLTVAAGASQAASVYAPYVDMTIYPTPRIEQIGVQQGIQQFNLAFVVAGNGCAPSWGGVQTIDATQDNAFMTAIATSITNFRAKGGDVAVSFGGANGTPLMQACGTVTALEAAYRTVIDTYNLTHIDFDIEGASQQDTAAVVRNFQAVAQLQADYASKGKRLSVTLTLPAMPYGLTQDGTDVINAAIRNNAAFDVVNLMTMDYGGGIDMGGAAVDAAQALYSQLDAAFKAVGQIKTNAQLWALVGVTPMIGMNDVQGETFTLANAKTVLSAARTDGYGMLGNWSVTRDRACANNGAYTSPTCSGIVQKPYDFAAVFRGVPGHWGDGVTQDPSHGSGQSDAGSGGAAASPGPAWSSTQVYTGGASVIYQGVTYQAQWWTLGDIPGEAAVWKAVSGGASAQGGPWTAAKVYTAGMTVVYEGTRYEAQWWTHGDTPGVAAVWQAQGGGMRGWSATVAYQGGQCVMYQNAKYCAKWWTQGDTPSSGGVWVKS